MDGACRRDTPVRSAVTVTVLSNGRVRVRFILLGARVPPYVGCVMQTLSVHFHFFCGFCLDFCTGLEKNQADEDVVGVCVKENKSSSDWAMRLPSRTRARRLGSLLLLNSVAVIVLVKMYHL